MKDIAQTKPNRTKKPGRGPLTPAREQLRAIHGPEISWLSPHWPLGSWEPIRPAFYGPVTTPLTLLSLSHHSIWCPISLVCCPLNKCQETSLSVYNAYIPTPQDCRSWTWGVNLALINNELLCSSSILKKKINKCLAVILNFQSICAFYPMHSTSAPPTFVFFLFWPFFSFLSF